MRFDADAPPAQPGAPLSALPLAAPLLPPPRAAPVRSRAASPSNTPTPPALAALLARREAAAGQTGQAQRRPASPAYGSSDAGRAAADAALARARAAAGSANAAAARARAASPAPNVDASDVPEVMAELDAFLSVLSSATGRAPTPPAVYRPNGYSAYGGPS
jgi:hypothetical protein